MIEAKSIKHNFGDNHVLHDVSFQVGAREIFGLLGPSGAGKTTLINILTKQFPPTGGTFNVEAGPFEMGLMLEEDGLYKRLTCFENLRLFAGIYGVDTGKGAIGKVLSQVGLGDAFKRPVSKLSKGMRQRLAIARAIINKPKVLFLDEPTANLDPATALEIHKLIRKLQEDGATIFMTTHNMEEAATLCSKIALLDQGKILEYGSPKEICDRHDAYKTVEDLAAVFIKLTEVKF
jgi:ABC-2 type transport system ATP-binding protein